MRKALSLIAAVLLASSAGGSSTTVVAEDPPTCDRFTLEKVRLGLTQSEVEALSLGKLEIMGQTTDTVRLRVRRSKHQQQILILLIHGRVQKVQVVLNADAANAAAALSELRGRWGEPLKEEDADNGQGGSGDRFAVKNLRWSDRSCQAFGAYWYNSSTLYLLLSSSPDSIRRLHPDADLPAVVR